ncbi:MAG: hypothetical protein SWY16_01240 [Cyanobacteriota bacterium]|nr:hypothetical protein [Cyanobacteriota bacterium]
MLDRPLFPPGGLGIARTRKTDVVGLESIEKRTLAMAGGERSVHLRCDRSMLIFTATLNP